MGILRLFSKRQQELRGEVADVYVYDFIPPALRVQTIHIIRDSIGVDIAKFSSMSRTPAMGVYDHINKALAKEYGLFSLGNKYEDSKESLFNFILSEQDFEKVMDALEFTLSIINTYIRSDRNYEGFVNTAMKPDNAIDEINGRFKEHGIGYEFHNNQFIRIDSQLLHAEAIKPALFLLQGNLYAGANQEFMSAFDHYKNKRFKETLVDALKALESTLKAICKKRSWTYSQTDTAAKLLTVVFDNKLVPDSMQSHFSSLRSMLESGVPTVRNKMGGHGQGTSIVEVPAHFASFALNSAASAIVLLATSEAALP